MHAQLLDISAFGARLGILQKIPTHSAVTFYEHKLGVGGRGTVRFCRTARKGYEVGLEFPNGTGWSPAVREKADLLKPTATVCRDQPVFARLAGRPDCSFEGLSFASFRWAAKRTSAMADHGLGSIPRHSTVCRDRPQNACQRPTGVARVGATVRVSQLSGIGGEVALELPQGPVLTSGIGDSVRVLRSPYLTET